MGSPPGVCNAGVGVKDFVHVDARVCNQLAEFGHLAHLFKGKYLILLVTIDGETSGVVPSVLEAGKSWKE